VFGVWLVDGNTIPDPVRAIQLKADSGREVGAALVASSRYGRGTDVTERRKALAASVVTSRTGRSAGGNAVR
jgi:hypothetical protein